MSHKIYYRFVEGRIASWKAHSHLEIGKELHKHSGAASFNICFDVPFRNCFFRIELCWAWMPRCCCSAPINQNVFTHVFFSQIIMANFRVVKKTRNDFPINNRAWASKFMLSAILSICSSVCLAYLQIEKHKQTRWISFAI